MKLLLCKSVRYILALNYVIYMMEELIKRAEEMGIDAEDLIITAMSRKDPKEGIKLRLTLARKYMAKDGSN